MTVTKTLAGDFITSTKCLTAHEVRVGGGLTISAPHAFHSDPALSDPLVKNRDVRMVPKQLVFTIPSENPEELFLDSDSLGVPNKGFSGRDNRNLPTQYTLDGDILVHGVGLKVDGTKIVLTTDGSGESSLDKTEFDSGSSTTSSGTTVLTDSDVVLTNDSTGATSTATAKAITIDPDGSGSTVSEQLVTVALLKELLAKVGNHATAEWDTVNALAAVL